MTMGKQVGKQSQLGSFSFDFTNDKGSDCIFITFGIPKVINLPYVGPITIETIGVATATCVVPWLLWLGRRTARRIQQRIKDKQQTEREKAESPARAKTWEYNNHTKLDEWMNEVKASRDQLRKVEDPDTVEKRQEKRVRIKKEQTKKPKGPLGLSAELLQNSRTGLRQSADAPLASYLDKNRDSSIDDNLKILEGRLENDIKTHAELVKSGKMRNRRNDEEDENVENANKCTIS